MAGHPDLTGYDLEVRNVTDVPAFAQIRRALALRAHEQVVLLLPSVLMDQVRVRQREAVRRAGLSWEQAAGTRGRFEPLGSGVVFRVMHVDPR